MKTLHAIALGILVSGSCAVTHGASLELNILPRFNQAPLAFDSLTNQTATRQTISVTRLDFLMSDIALHREGGFWVSLTNQFACMSAREGRTSVTLSNVPGGTFDRLRFQIGVPPAINHADLSQWPAGHPLNPDVNQLYWGWSREYVFLAFEGRWQNGTKESGFSYHLATDKELMTIELAVALDTRSAPSLQVALNVDKILSGRNIVGLSDATDTTHSRVNDALAMRLRENVENAFAVAKPVEMLPVKRTEARVPARGVDAASRNKIPSVLIAPDATPYRLTISKFFPRPDLPADNPLTVEGVSLGSQLFFDRRLSADNSESCAACHHPRDSFAENRRFSRGIGGEIGTRNAMPLENLAWKKEFFWDGRATSLREQVLQPIQNPIEMHESLDYLVKKLNTDTNYHRLFANAFGSGEISPDRIARALEQFLLVQVSFDSKFDRVMQGKGQFTSQELRGFQLFHTEYDPYHGQYGADCFHCHGGALFQSQSFANNGLDSKFEDPGRYVMTKLEGDRGKFAVPSLRNVAVTGPYMHDGRFRTLEEVVEHYCTGMKRSATLDPNLAKHPDGGVPLNASDKLALVAFLKTLTDERFLAPAVAVRGAR